ncbi:hypothetical protein PC116_g14807 [Phytophthora cactorum]|uniref:Uncharacterized protein n=1 Tax=Phytophthora cactorum TaxID=29920 RepID=A0A8T1ALA3_9STRA|nr:hypothetical protein PC112_g21355 [Phytophthora cactorum]KAG2814733.1 hypothetical protein PC111_g13846 [Phytophthora cactorum]KAG2881892.1 hypothetical protein PC115_g22094 [Phytophthora cactorum]KAG2967860.1 hypothetical protein PC119_g24361 [Phytophthora cactorum]KAG4237130.1 hypothetical protein PC116_g14807 [Phytophthora cactorum]
MRGSWLFATEHLEYSTQSWFEPSLHLHHGFAKPPLELKLLSSSNFLNFSSESFEAGVHFLGAALFLFYEQALLGWIEIVRLKIFHDEI